MNGIGFICSVHMIAENPEVGRRAVHLYI